jgi:hypothetical protein
MVLSALVMREEQGAEDVAAAMAAEDGTASRSASASAVSAPMPRRSRSARSATLDDPFGEGSSSRRQLLPQCPWWLPELYADETTLPAARPLLPGAAGRGRPSTPSTSSDRSTTAGRRGAKDGPSSRSPRRPFRH